MAKSDYCGVSSDFMAKDSRYQPWAHSLADALYAMLDNKQICGKVLEQMATGPGVPKADGSASDGKISANFDAALKGLSKCPDAQLTAAACLARLCNVELQSRPRPTSSLPPFCQAIETAATFIGVVCCMQRALEVIPILPLPHVLSQVRLRELVVVIAAMSISDCICCMI